MLQRQIMFKQMQELQRRQQMQELNDSRTQAYSNQMPPGGQYPPTVNGTPVNDSSQMFMLGNMQMMQHGGSSGLQGVPNGMVLSQNQHPSLGSMGLSQPQYGVSLYGTPAPNVDKNLNQYSQFQGPSDISGNLLAKNNNMSLGMSSLQPLAFGGSFMNQRSNFSSNQNDTQDGAFQSGQVYQEKNLFGQVPVQSFNSGNLSGSYSDRGIVAQRNFSHLESEGRHDDGTWRGDSRGNDSKFGLPQASSTLDPLEQKILFNTDDNGWGSFSRNLKMETGHQESPMQHTSYMDEFPSMQGGSWSALMQSAVAETSSSDTGVQEEWSGLSFQNPETSTDVQPSNFIDNGRPQNNWIDRNKLNAPSSDSKPVQLFQSSNKSNMFPGFSQPGHQQNQFHSETFHASTQQSPRSMSQPNDHDAQQKQSTGRSQLIQTSSPSKSIWPGQHNEHSNNNANKPHNYYGNNGHDTRGTLWPHQGTSHQTAGGFEKQYDQANHLNARKYATESNNVAPGNNVEQMSNFLGNSSGFQRVTAQSENVLQLFGKDTKSNDQTSGVHLNLKVSSPSELPQTESVTKSPNTSMSGGFSFPLGLAGNQTQQPYPFFPSLSMGNPSAASVPSRNINDYIKNQASAPSLGGHMTKSPAYGSAASPDNSQSKSIRSSGPDFPLSENMSLTQPSVNAGVSENVGFSLGSPAPWSNMKTQQELPFQKSNVMSNVIRPADSATSSGAANDNQKLFKQEYNVLESGHSGQSEYSEKVLQRGSSDREGSIEMNSASWLGSSAHNKQSESDAVAPVTRQLPPRQAEQRHDEAPAGLARDIGAFGHGSRIIQANRGIDYQQSIADANNLFSGGQNSGGKDKAIVNADGPKTGSLLPANNKQWNFSQEDQLGRAPVSAYLQNLQAANMFGQIDTQKSSMSSNEASNVQYQSQINMQVAPSWFKHYGNLKDGQMSNPKPILNAVQPFSGIAQGGLLEKSLSMQVNLSNAYQGSNVLPSTAVPPIASKPVVSPSILLPDLSQQTMLASMSKKRKVAAFELIPWHKEVHYEPSRIQVVSMAGLQWAQASNRIPEVKYKGETAEDSIYPAVRAKRRLVFTTELMQQVFSPPPAVILRADASNCDDVVHFSARLALGDACSLTGQLPTETDEVSPDKLKTSNKASSPDFSKVAEVLIGRVQKLEDDLSRVEKRLSIVDVKFEAQELEKFSTINRFAKFHIKSQPSTGDPASSGPSTLPKMFPQRYVIPHPMPRVVPEAADCLSL